MWLVIHYPDRRAHQHTHTQSQAHNNCTWPPTPFNVQTKGVGTAKNKRNESLVQYYEVFVKCRRRTMATETEKGENEKGKREEEEEGKREKREKLRSMLKVKITNDN